MNIGGIPVIIDKFMPKNELWMIEEGKKSMIHAHEGPHAGEDVETWLRKPQVIRFINLGGPK